MAGPRRLSVLVVDDAYGVRESLKATFESAGHEAVTAEHGRGGLAAMSERSFDALVTDLWMHEVDGIELLRLAKRTYPRMRLIAITGGGPGLSVEAAAALAQSWCAEKIFLKPFDERELVSFLEKEAESLE